MLPGPAGEPSPAGERTGPSPGWLPADRRGDRNRGRPFGAAELAAGLATRHQPSASSRRRSPSSAAASTP